MALSTQTLNEIKHHIKGDVSDSPSDLETFSRDTSLFVVRPSLVVFPKDEDDVEALVQIVSSAKKRGEDIALTGRSAGTDMTGGPLTESIVLSFTRYMNHFVGWESGSHTERAVVEPGMFYRDFEKETLKHNLLMPSYPASREIAAIGGMVANNCAGEKTLTFGKIEKYVKKMRVVLSDGKACDFGPLTLIELEEKKQLHTFEGEVYRKTYELIEKNYDLLTKAKPKVSKNSSGYMLWNVLDKEKGTFDLSKLFVGSQGTLGIHTKITLSLIKPKHHTRLLVIFLKNTDILPGLINHVLQFKPESFESYDDHTFRIALKMFPQIVKRLGGNIFSLGIQFLPEFFAVLTGGIPKLVLLAEFTGDSDNEAFLKAQEAEESIKEYKVKSRITQNEAEAEKYWVVRRESFNLLRQKVKNMRTAPFIDDLVVLPEVLPEFIPRLYALLDSYNLTYTIAGHMGDANFHIIPLMDLTDPKSKKIIHEIADKVFDLVFRFKGSITAEHNDGIMRTPYLPKMFGLEVYSLFEQTKHIFDPEGIFNPGKKVGGSFEYTYAHIDTH